MPAIILPSPVVSSASEVSSQGSQIHHQVHLQVGEQHFTTTRATLTGESGFFASLFDKHEGSRLLGIDMPLMVDADGDLFKHVLRYLRRGVLPIFYEKDKGHNHALYLALLIEARFFIIPRLEMWLADKKYLKAVKFTYDVSLTDGYKGLGIFIINDKDVEFRNVEIKRGYVCPRGIIIHRKFSDCGKLCARKRWPGGNDNDVNTLRATVIMKGTVIDEQMCLEGRREFDSTSELMSLEER